MGLINFSNIQDGTTIDANDVNGPFNTIYDEFNGNITNANIASNAAIAGTKLASGSVTNTQINFGGGGNGVWWEEIGRTTLSVAGDTITVSNLPQRRYLKILIHAFPTGGSIGAAFRFNNDSGNNYARRVSNDGGADATSVSQSSAFAGTSTADAAVLYEGILTNLSTQEKLLIGHAIGSNGTGAANAPNRNETVNKWANTTDQITRIDVLNLSGTGDYAIGSEVIVLAHD